MLDRRRFLMMLGAAGMSGGIGCARRGAEAQTNAGQTVSLMAAGSLNNAFENGLRNELAEDIALEIETHGSAAVARLIAERQRDPDIISLADVALFDGPLYPDWYVEFATNSIVIAYNPDSDGGRRLAAADRWYEPVLDGTVRLGRTDPDADPLGYRALFMFELAARYYNGAPNLRTRIPRRDQMYPETALISQFETGAIDAAVAYRNMAIERNYAYIALPPQIDLSDPAYESDWYATVAYALPSGKTVAGSVISYGSTIRRPSAAARQVFRTQLTGAYLGDFGFVVPSDYPKYHGDVPREVVA